MKKLFIAVTAGTLFSVGFVLAQSNDMGLPASPAPPDSPAGWVNIILTALTPIVMAGIKWGIPKIPKVLLPFLAPAVGVGLTQLAALASTYETNLLIGAIVGTSGLWLRELLDQLKKATKDTPVAPLNN